MAMVKGKIDNIRATYNPAQSDATALSIMAFKIKTLTIKGLLETLI
jgi:hypothetical protein